MTDYLIYQDDPEVDPVEVEESAPITDHDPGDEHRDPWPFYVSAKPFEMPTNDDMVIWFSVGGPVEKLPPAVPARVATFTLEKK